MGETESDDEEERALPLLECVALAGGSIAVVTAIVGWLYYPNIQIGDLALAAVGSGVYAAIVMSVVFYIFTALAKRVAVKWGESA